MVAAGEIAVVALLAGGVFFALVAAVGLLRLPDLYTRAHAASKSDTLGAVLSLAAVALIFGTDVTTAKTIFLVAFMFITNPTAAHAIVRAAHDQGIEPWTVADRDTEVGPAAGGGSTEKADETTSEAATDGGTSGSPVAVDRSDVPAVEPTDTEAAAGAGTDHRGEGDRTGGEKR